MYLNIVQLAESFGVEEAVVEGWVRDEGLPCVRDRDRLLFDRSQVATWAAAKGMAAKAGFLAMDRPQTAATCQLESLLRIGGIWRGVAASELTGVLEQVVSKLPGTTPPVRQLLTQRLRAPNAVSWAPVGDGFALPHLRAPAALGRESGILALLLMRDSLPLEEPAADGIPVTRLLFFIAPSPRMHLEFLSQLSAALTKGRLRQAIIENGADDRILAALAGCNGNGNPSMTRRPEGPS